MLNYLFINYYLIDQPPQTRQLGLYIYHIYACYPRTIAENPGCHLWLKDMLHVMTGCLSHIQTIEGAIIIYTSRLHSSQLITVINDNYYIGFFFWTKIVILVNQGTLNTSIYSICFVLLQPFTSLILYAQTPRREASFNWIGQEVEEKLATQLQLRIVEI